MCKYLSKTFYIKTLYVWEGDEGGRGGGRGHITFGADSTGVGVTLYYLCIISCEPVVGILPNFNEYVTGDEKAHGPTGTRTQDLSHTVQAL